MRGWNRIKYINRWKYKTQSKSKKLKNKQIIWMIKKVHDFIRLPNHSYS